MNNLRWISRNRNRRAFPTSWLSSQIPAVSQRTGFFLQRTATKRTAYPVDPSRPDLWRKRGLFLIPASLPVMNNFVNSPLINTTKNTCWIRNIAISTLIYTKVIKMKTINIFMNINKCLLRLKQDIQPTLSQSQSFTNSSSDRKYFLSSPLFEIQYRWNHANKADMENTHSGLQLWSS